jgi:hypothetical protein
VAARISSNDIDHLGLRLPPLRPAERILRRIENSHAVNAHPNKRRSWSSALASAIGRCQTRAVQHAKQVRPFNGYAFLPKLGRNCAALGTRKKHEDCD